MEGNEGDGRDDQIKDQGVKREQNANEDDDAHNGCDDSCFHRVLFLLWKSAGGGFCSNAAEPTGALVEFRDGGVQVVAGEIRPENIHLYQLGVGSLPEHEVGQPLLARWAAG